MGFFSRRRTINGRPQPNPEEPGSLERRFRLFVECERRLASDPLAARAAMGQPIGEGMGLEGLVAKIAPLFAQERSLIRWVALRGAYAELFTRVIDPESAVHSPADLEHAMGLEWVPNDQGETHPDLALPWRNRVTPAQTQAALGISSSVLMRAEDYGRYSRMNLEDVIADPRLQIPIAVALDGIAWSAIALLRLGLAQQLFSQAPEPDALDKPGWYTDPLFAKAQRFWDGTDWTARCRLQSGQEVSAPLA